MRQGTRRHLLTSPYCTQILINETADSGYACMTSKATLKETFAPYSTSIDMFRLSLFKRYLFCCIAAGVPDQHSKSSAQTTPETLGRANGRRRSRSIQCEPREIESGLNPEDP